MFTGTWTDELICEVKLDDCVITAWNSKRKYLENSKKK